MHNIKINENKDNKFIENSPKSQMVIENVISKSQINILNEPLKNKHQIDITVNGIYNLDSWMNNVDSTKQTNSTKSYESNKSNECSKDSIKNKYSKDDKIMIDQKMPHKKAKIILSNFIYSIS